MALGKKTGGRKKGSLNKRTKAQAKAVEKVAAQIEAAIPEAFEGDAHAYLMGVYKDPKADPAVRRDAAKAALPYEKSRLATIAHTGADGGPIQARVIVVPAKESGG